MPPEPTPPAPAWPTIAYSAPNVWGPAPDPADPNAPADPWAEDRAAIRRAVATVLRAAREHGCLREDPQ